MDSRKYQEPSAPPPPYSSVVNSDQYSNRVYPELREQRTPEFDQFINRYESECVSRRTRVIIDKWIYLVNPNFAARLYGLKGYEIVFICDDSGSMTAPIGESPLHPFVSIHWILNFSGEATSPYGKQRTRCKISIKVVMMCSRLFLCYFQGMN
jgi:hypothetical protein